ncbi:hypothetical protein A3J34_01735 [Candidatus Peribacteria bacterium RIFCSPLOWO2_02_FULL_51_10]|nr:MAG: hypothetical protein A3C52_03210 [Candidatus Peribacteria bacterium RIFCSPHIGHO2_02_FULL_51_15]OGJ68711.1 MAG: hypothetical protein A3J34_01735 [Candidatus Peribacteria bacterium RIFCSPLOWO2_02_FULL_51_10]
MPKNIRSRARRLDPPVIIGNAKVIKGAGRGRRMDIPTLNLDIAAVPRDLAHGIYACEIAFQKRRFMGAMHFGPRPVFDAPESFEIHVLDWKGEKPPQKVDLRIVARIREIKNFSDVVLLKAAIAEDIQAVRAILGRA